MRSVKIQICQLLRLGMGFLKVIICGYKFPRVRNILLRNDMLRQVPVASHMTVVDAWSQHSLYNENLKRAMRFQQISFIFSFLKQMITELIWSNWKVNNVVCVLYMFGSINLITYDICYLNHWCKLVAYILQVRCLLTFIYVFFSCRCRC